LGSLIYSLFIIRTPDMNTRLALLFSAILMFAGTALRADSLTVATNFEGASAANVQIDNLARSISFTPGGDPRHGWPCWWYFRVNGLTPGEKITLHLRGSPAVTSTPGPLAKPLSPTWSMPSQATISTDGKNWVHTAKGVKAGSLMTYTITPDATSVYVAWGPPYTPITATEFIRQICARSPHAQAEELCRSLDGRPVPMLHVMEGARPPAQRFGVWVQARQHAWESGSSWVGQGFAEWLLSADPDAAWLRQYAEIFIVPIMDVDNTATGNGGKDAIPHDHNRDWSEAPHWNEVVAAQKRVRGLIQAGRMDVFLDLHNPGPDDPTFFFLAEKKVLKEPMISLCDRFTDLAYGRISKAKPFIPMSSKTKTTGPAYHPLWKQISACWVSMNGNPTTVSVCLETIWNAPNSTTEGYRTVGANLAAAVREYLAERPASR
jgi:Zinc carboxypeptidase/Cytosolic carboxypeptidase N-terminal domain